MSKSIIVAPQPLAVEAGARVLRDGGNAVDAALACAFVQGLVHPTQCGIGGYMMATVRLPNGETRVLDAPGLAGSKATPEMWQDKVIGANPEGWGYFVEGRVNELGYTSICTPNALHGFAEMLRRWGTISWARAIEPAIEAAENGYAMEQFHAMSMKRRALPGVLALTAMDTIMSNEEARRVFLKSNDQNYEEGELVRNPDFGRTLRLLAERGVEDFYRGALAVQISADIEANGGYVTADDLANPQLRDDAPLTGTYRGYTIETGGAPHGGPTLLAILNILSHYDLGSLEHNSPEYIYRVSMAMKAAFADRNPYLGDPLFVDARVEWMTSQERAAHWARVIDAGEPIHVSFTPMGTPDTTHVSVIDREGLCVALTHSLGACSGAITPGLGFMYNNSMLNFHPFPGHPNSIAPGKSRTTGMCPTVVSKEGKPVLVLGGHGATRIITSTLHVILNMIDFGMSAADAVNAPRFDCQVGAIRCQARIPEYVCAEVRQRHPIERIAQSVGGLGLIHAAAFDMTTGKLSGQADPGTGGMALIV